MSPELQLIRGREALGIALVPLHIEKLLAYLAMLAKWNKVYNLTAVRDETKMVSHHLLDSLAVLPHISAKRLLDVGSGGGLPGIPLAIARPQMRVTLLDSNQKKAAFLKQAAIELELGNVEVTSDRVEEFDAPEGYNVIISRAFADLGEFLSAARHLLAPGGRLVAMKGVVPHEEMNHLPTGFKVESAVALNVPGVNAQRHLVIVSAHSQNES
jgi:16S rRNA (guanine527-N7)-methyltransferase